MLDSHTTSVRRGALRHRPRRPGDPTLYAQLTIAVWPEGDQWVSQCLELDIASSGPDPDTATLEAGDAVSSYVNTLEELGERERVFAERSIAVYSTPPAMWRPSDVPREIAGRDRLQVRPASVPVDLPGRKPVIAG